MEGFGIPIAESFAGGTDVLCTDLPSMREVGGDFAQFLPADDIQAWSKAIASLLETVPVSGIKERAKSFSWKRQVEGICSLIELIHKQE